MRHRCAYRAKQCFTRNRANGHIFLYQDRLHQLVLITLQHKDISIFCQRHHLRQVSILSHYDRASHHLIGFRCLAQLAYRSAHHLLISRHCRQFHLCDFHSRRQTFQILADSIVGKAYFRSLVYHHERNMPISDKQTISLEVDAARSRGALCISTRTKLQIRTVDIHIVGYRNI